MTHRLTETTPLAEAGTGPSGRMKVHAITAGLGSSGLYRPEVLREAATNQLISKGTPLFLDHASETDRHNRPERSVRDIAAVFTEAATYDEAAQALVGEIQVFAPYRDLLTEMAPHIGLSISGSATDVTEGEHEGRQVPVIEGLAAIDSVDFVTRAGRGGKVVELFESARVNARALGRGVAEATVNDTREALQTQLRDAYGVERVGQTAATYVWVRDFDATTVWFEVDGPGSDSGLYAQAYTQADTGAVALTGDRTEVRVQTKYVPVNPAGQPITQESKEDTMPQIEEARLRELEEAHGRVPTLESERDAQQARADQAEATLAERDRRDRAREIVAERATDAKVTFSPLEERGLIADLPVKEDALDEEAFTKTVDEAAKAKAVEAARLAESAGQGRVFGYGHTVTTPGGDTGLTEAEMNTRLGIKIGA